MNTLANIIQINGKNVKDSTAARMASLAPVEASTTATAAHAVGEYFWLGGALYEATAAIAVGDTITVGTNCKVATLGRDVTNLKSQIEEISQTGIDASGASDGQVPVADGQGSWAWDDPAGGVSDVQVNGVSVVTDGVANVPAANTSGVMGVVKPQGQTFSIDNSAILNLRVASTAEIKAGTTPWRPAAPNNQHWSTFYGLAKAAGDTTQSASANAVGQYTDAAKSAISEMLNGSVTVTGTTPSITALPGVRYVCGEVSTIDITVPATGIVDVVFTSGATPAVLTVTPPTGVTMKWANGFDPTTLEANTVYEINIMDGCYGVVGTWT